MAKDKQGIANDPERVADEAEISANDNDLSELISELRMREVASMICKLMGRPYHDAERLAELRVLLNRD